VASIFDDSPTYGKLNSDKYVVVQVTLTEAFIGTGSKKSSLDLLQNTINKMSLKGYKLCHMSSASVFSKGLLGGDKNQVTMIFEKDDTKELILSITKDLKMIREKICPESIDSETTIENDDTINNNEISQELEDKVEIDIETAIQNAISIMDTRSIYNYMTTTNEEIVKELVYKNAKDKLNNGKKASAKALFNIISDYKDVDDILSKIK